MSMTNDYIDLATRTESIISDINNLNLRLLHSVIGLSTEIMEINEAFYEFKYNKINRIDSTNILEEVGDLFWYIAIGCDVLKLDFKNIIDSAIDDTVVFNPEKYANDSELIINKLLDKVKRHIFYRKQCDEEEIKNLYNDLTIKLYKLVISTGATIDSVLRKNIEKLKIRYPEKYSDYHAINRDLNEERKILENEN